MKTKKHIIFIGCSSEAMPVAEAVRSKLDGFAECRIWNDDIITIGQYTLSEIEKVIKESDFCIFLLAADDELISRSQNFTCPRDNVILELGLSMGILGSDRTFIIRENSKDLKFPSDLGGMTVGTFETGYSNLISSVGRACNNIKSKITQYASANNRKKIIIAISGSQGVGKTTTIGDLNRYLSQSNDKSRVVVKSEIARDLIKKGVGSDQNTKSEDYGLYIAKHLEYYDTNQAEYDVKLLDRTLLDVLAFANANQNVHDNWVAMLLSLVKIVLTEVDYYFYIPIQDEVKLVDDGSRNVDESYRLKIDGEILNLLSMMYPKFIQLDGNRNERINKIIEIIN